MPNTYASVGCLPSQKAMSSVTQEERRRLTYSTTSGTGVPGRVRTEDSYAENMMSIHNIGRQDSKYMKYQLCTAPLLDKSSVTSRRDYTTLPLGDNVINSALAESFKGGLNAGNKGLEVSAKSESAYKAEFVGYTGDLMKRSKQKSVKPKSSRTQTITGMTDMLETRPLSHVTYAVPNAELAQCTEILKPKCNLGSSGKWEGPAPSTSYKSEFCREYKRDASLPDIRSFMGHGTGSPSGLLPDNHPAFKMKRVGYMSPGQ